MEVLVPSDDAHSSEKGKVPVQREHADTGEFDARGSDALGAETGKMRSRFPEISVAEFEGRESVELISAEDLHSGIRVAARVGRRYAVACTAEIGLAETDRSEERRVGKEGRTRKRP